MSLIELILSRREIVFSLALVGLVLVMALLLALAPVLRRRWKRAMKQRRLKRAAKLARLKEQRMRARQNQAEEEGLIAEEPLPEVEEIPTEPEIPAEPAEEEEPLDSALSELQSMFEGVFEDEEVNAKYATLLKGTESISAEDLAKLANQVAEQLDAQPPPQREDS